MFRRLRVHDERVIFDEPIKFNEKIRYGINHAPTKSIYLWTDSGNLFRVRPAENAWRILKQSKSAYERYTNSPDAPELQSISALEDCLVCHSGLGDSPPALRGIIGRRIASSNYEGYSDSLMTKTGVWTVSSLKHFLRAPQEFAPGTSMPDPMLSSDQEINKILEELEKMD